MSGQEDPGLTLDERLRLLYPAVDESETPLPRCWSTTDKYNFIGLSMNNLRVQYKGHGKNHKDASSVRATNSVPAACGIYYFEVRIVSKGRDGYMGVGLSAQGVNMNRLPGWDKNSYGYHGDDGHSFCSSGTGQAYGPTFTTGDVIGCGVNLVDGSCFYTKNGHNLGVAFNDLPPGLYPTVGLQTPGEIVDANFGQEPFMFDIEGEMVEHKARILRQIEIFPEPGRHGDWQFLLHQVRVCIPHSRVRVRDWKVSFLWRALFQMVSTYLVHHGFSSTAETFNRVTGQKTEEDAASIKNRQSISHLVLAGKMGEAVQTTDRLYPDLLSKNPNLHFKLKVRQFIEMVSGCDSVENVRIHEPEGFPNNSSGQPEDGISCSSSGQQPQDMMTNGNCVIDNKGEKNVTDGMANNHVVDTMTTNGNSVPEEEEDLNCSPSADDMEVDGGVSNNSILSNPARFDKLIKFGQSLQLMLSDMSHQPSQPPPQPGSSNSSSNNISKLNSNSSISDKTVERNSKMLQDAFSLLAYADPRSSPVGWQLEQRERELVSAALNSAILESAHLPPNAPLEVAIGHTKQLLKVMATNDLGACAFASVEDFLR